MVYRKTEKVLAQLEARRNSIVASAIDVIAKSGMEGCTTDLVAKRAGIANGLMYHYFPDKTELLAAVIAQLLARDLAAIRERTRAEKNPLNALAVAIAVSYGRFTYLPLVRAIRAEPVYNKGIRDELERLIRAAVDDQSPSSIKFAARAALGTIFGMADAHGRDEDRASATVLFVLRGIGVSDSVARKVVARCWGSLVAVA